MNTFMRLLKPRYVGFVALVSLGLSSNPVSAAFLQDSSGPQLLTIEVENYTSNTPRGGDAWESPTVPIGNFSGAGDLRAQPDNGGFFPEDYSETSPEISFDVQMVATGTHFVHYRGHAPNASSDSLHIGFDRQEGLDTEDYGLLRTPGYTWSNGNRVIEVDSVGTHSLQVWMREDGIYIDKIVLTTDPNWEPVGLGPPESPGGDDLIPVLDPIGDQTVAEGANLNFVVTGSDDNGVVTFDVVNLPNGAVFDQATGAFDWTPAPGQARDYVMTFFAVDSANQTSREEITITVTGTGSCFFKQDTSGDFFLSIEAEHFPVNTPLSGDAWELVENHPAGFSGPGILQVGPDDGDVININYHNIAPELSANAEFAATGTHHVWVRGRGQNGAGNSMHVGLDDIPFVSSRTVDLAAGNNLVWSNGTDNFPVDTLGVHSVEAWMREDGIFFDKIVVTTNPNFVPTGVGPAESSCGPLGDAVPVLDSIGDRNAETGNALTFTVTATDDVSTPTLGVMSLPVGATFNTTSGVFDWTPGAQDIGTHVLTFRATDSFNQINEETIEVTVTGDSPPVLDPIGPQTATANVLLSFVVTASDGGGSPTLSATNLPGGATFSPATGLFEWTPGVADIGTVDVTFTATDNVGQTDDEVVTITVAGDQPPVLNPIGPQSVLVGALLEFTVTATDDADIPTLSAVDLPGSASFTPGTGVFSWTPGLGDVGSVDVTFRATDSSNGFDEEVVTITVTSVGSCSYIQANGGDSLLVIEAENFPGNISRLGDTWQVPNSPVQGFSGTAALQALPDNGTFVSTNFAQTSPEISAVANFSATGTHYVWVRGHGINGGGDSLHVGIDGEEVPTSAGITIPRTSGYEWSNGSHTLDVGNQGIHTLQAWMREDGTYIDKVLLTTNPNFVPTGIGPPESVCGIAGDLPPVLDEIGPQSVEEGELLNFVVTATDDNGIPSLSTVDLPPGADFNSTTGEFDWIPGAGTSGTFDVTFIATDSANQTDAELVVITVGADAPPVLDNIGARSATEGVLLSFVVSATDDNGSPTLSATNVPAGATFDAATGEFNWTPAAGDAGVFNVTFTATDTANQTDDEEVQITVSAAGSCSFQQASSGSFLLSIEAENFPTRIGRAGDDWVVPGNLIPGFSGQAALQTLPDNGTFFPSNYAGAASELIANAEFQASGQHFVWLRGVGISGGSDSLHAGIDGVESASSAGIGIPRTGGYEWSDGSHTIDVSSTGIHPVNIWVREDGTYVDKIVITNDPGFIPTGIGPAESVCAGSGDQPPVLAPIGAQQVDEGSLLAFTVSADDDNGAPTLSVSGLPTGATFNEITGEFDWTPVPGDAGTYTVTFTATDSANQTDSENVVITVSSVGGGGVCSFQQSDSGEFLLTIEAESFPTNIPRSGDTWLVPSNPVSGFSGSAALQALPDNRDAILTNYAATSPELSVTATFAATGTHYVWVRGHGVSGGSDSVHFGLDGAEISTARAIGIPRTSGYEWSDGADTVNVTSAGLHSLQIWMREDGAYVDKILLTTDPNFVPTGTGPAESTCSSNGGDQPPVLDPIGPQNVVSGTQLSFFVSATDDISTPTLTATNLPNQASFDPATGEFLWTPTTSDIGVVNVTFTATDSSNQTDDETVAITVTGSGGGDQPPVLNPIGPQSVAEEAPLSFTVTATDDIDTPVLSATGVPAGANFDTASGVFSWTPPDGSAGTFNVTFVATDGSNQTDSEVVQITVSDDEPPVLDPIGQQMVAENSPLVFTVTATDDDGSPALSASGVPAGASFDTSSGVFQWTPAVGRSVDSPFSITFIATDQSNQTDTETVTILVLPQSQSPFLQDSGPDAVVSVEGESFHSNIARSGDVWEIPASPVAGFSGAAAMQTLPDDGDSFLSNYANSSPQLSYEVEFVTTGRHYIWVRGVGVRGGSDSVHVGLDSIESTGGTNIGIPRTTPLSYQWSDGSDFVDVNTVGLHTVDAWMREDGTYIDKIVLSTNPNFNPTGFGPQQSFRVSDCQIFPSTQISTPRSDDLQTSTTIEVETFTCLDSVDHAGWGVKFELDGGAAGGGSEQIVTSAPYTASFAGVSLAEHSISIVLVDENSVEQTGGDVTDSVSAVGVGDYYVAFGDSITFGFGDDVFSDDTSADGRNSGGGYTPILNDLLTADRQYPHTVVNEGVSGDTSIDGLAGINAVIGRNPGANFYLLKFGMNDARVNNPTPSGIGLQPGDAGYVGTFKDNMQQIIDAIQATGAQVVLSRVNPALGDSSNGAQYPDPETGARTVNIIEFNLVVGELETENNLSIIGPDFFDFFLLNFSAEYFDNIHPNGAGYESMADLWADQL